ncbi:MAG: bifunctional (p)ppGpp synthetase/guanosine-3',5'-bis(diphosphate) 3'-pyrophosphohydrolase, partial [Gammaproteobacteria bacterium]|nr:bifunctional (p)ppGpp synthetase/guanosine-3',5'-bis(diphosphate) 3'-pyrophosphohydrolase [Gammaproteobacteria bacterium]
GTEGMVMSFAKCCRPIPGDPIKGFISSGRGIVIHVESCKNVTEDRARSERWIDVQWAEEVSGEYPVEIRVEVVNRMGVLATVAAAVSEMDANIGNVVIEDRDGKYSMLTLTLEVRNRQHLAAVMRRVKALESVVRISRRRN